MRVISARELTLAYLARQMLLRRTAIGPVEAIDRLVAVQAQYSPSPYLALAARLAGFAIADLEECLRHGTIVKSTLMRGTLHLATASLYPQIAAVVQADSFRHWQRVWGRPGVQAEELARGLTEYLASPRSAAEIRAHVEMLTGGALPPRGASQGAKLLVPSVHVPPSGLWREHGAPGFIAWREALPAVSDASGRLVRHYLAGYGPATRADIVRFTQLRKPDLDHALATLEPLLRLVGEEGQELIDLPEAPRPDDDGLRPPPRLLPKWDSSLLSHADRSRILPANLRDRVINPANGDVAATYLLDGMVAGTWRVDRRGDHAVLSLRQLRPGAKHGGSALEQEARRTAAFMEPDATRIDIESQAEKLVASAARATVPTNFSAAVASVRARSWVRRAPRRVRRTRCVVVPARGSSSERSAPPETMTPSATVAAPPLSATLLWNVPAGTVYTSSRTASSERRDAHRTSRDVGRMSSPLPLLRTSRTRRAPGCDASESTTTGSSLRSWPNST
jgi:hypothetical protein